MKKILKFKKDREDFEDRSRKQHKGKKRKKPLRNENPVKRKGKTFYYEEE